MTAREERELRVLVERARELRGTGSIVDACEAIAAWQERRFLAREEHRQEFLALLRGSDPRRVSRRRAA